MLGDLTDPGNASLDSLIDWLRRKRFQNPRARLRELLPCGELDSRRLVDLACIDLMNRRRMGHAVSTEDYLDDFPTLDEAARLDLIDAEICVAHELGEAVDTETFVKRFPNLADSIRDLVKLDDLLPSNGSPVLGQDVSAPGVLAIGSSPTGLSRHDRPSSDDALPRLPVELPDWFVDAEVLVDAPDHQLVRGRDRKRGIVLALKSVKLPPGFDEAAGPSLLSVCEAASRVQHPSWTAPLIAALANQHLAVIRPWIFANPWRPGAKAERRVKARMRQLAGIAFALQAAHNSGASHGGVHPDNVLVDHKGRLHLVDAVCSVANLRRAGRDRPPGRNELSSPIKRIESDARGLIGLIDRVLKCEEHATSTSLRNRLTAIAARHHDQVCGVIGDELMRQSDR